MRTAQVTRQTGETEISVRLNLDGSGKADCRTGVPFLDHMLHALAKHGMLDLEVSASGDTFIDDHHTVEDTGICIGKALHEAIAQETRIHRYGDAACPLDDALVQVALDVSGRPYLAYNLAFGQERVGSFDVFLVKEFLYALSVHGGITLHMRQLAGENAHHVIEAGFKALARALRAAVTPDERRIDTPSTKGVLEGLGSERAAARYVPAEEK